MSNCITAIKIMPIEEWWTGKPKGCVAKDPAGFWWMCCPQCGGRATLELHTVIENLDGTLTLTPSILCPGNDTPVGHRMHCTAHYFITDNQLSGEW